METIGTVRGVEKLDRKKISFQTAETSFIIKESENLINMSLV